MIIKRMAALALGVFGFATQALAQANGTVERVYIAYCGEGTAINVAVWSPHVDVGKSVEFSNNCYLIKHAKGWLLFGTGLADSMGPEGTPPSGQRPVFPGTLKFRRMKTLADELKAINLSPADVKYVAISHIHPDNTGNIGMFPKSTFLIQKAEYEWRVTPAGVAPAVWGIFSNLHNIESQPVLLEGDHDVFGDGSVKLISTPGHTPGHQSLLVRTKNTGAVLLSGDAVHLRSNWENRRVPAHNVSVRDTLESMTKMELILKVEKAQLWINKDKAQTDSLRKLPAYYE